MDKKAIALIGLGAAGLTAGLHRLLGLVPIMPVAAAKEAAYVDHAFEGMLALTVPIFALVVSALAYSLLVFRARGPKEEGVRFHHSPGHFVEAVWLACSLVLTLGLTAYGARELRLVRGDDAADLDVQITAAQFSWEFYYPAHNQYSPRLVLPVGQRVRILLKSDDVVHSFWVPEFRLKQDVVPGKLVKLYLTPTRPGAYRLQCAELCGMEHTVMTAEVEVVEPAAFEKAMAGESW
ncbi:MAG: cytochrome c oxidase subunit II [Elusimicrobia bacterium]|nr:cytochrome c oxidase subunit II [Elusimicrobiota bacterium]